MPLALPMPLPPPPAPPPPPPPPCACVGLCVGPQSAPVTPVAGGRRTARPANAGPTSISMNVRIMSRRVTLNHTEAITISQRRMFKFAGNSIDILAPGFNRIEGRTSAAASFFGTGFAAKDTSGTGRFDAIAPAGGVAVTFIIQVSVLMETLRDTFPVTIASAEPPGAVPLQPHSQPVV